MFLFVITTTLARAWPRFLPWKKPVYVYRVLYVESEIRKGSAKNPEARQLAAYEHPQESHAVNYCLLTFLCCAVEPALFCTA